jgi:hypothetical protein
MFYGGNSFISLLLLYDCSGNITNCCLTSKVMPLAFYHSAIGKGHNSGGDLKGV